MTKLNLLTYQRNRCDQMTRNGVISQRVELGVCFATHWQMSQSSIILAIHQLGVYENQLSKNI